MNRLNELSDYPRGASERLTSSVYRYVMQASAQLTLDKHIYQENQAAVTGMRADKYRAHSNESHECQMDFDDTDATAYDTTNQARLSAPSGYAGFHLSDPSFTSSSEKTWGECISFSANRRLSPTTVVQSHSGLVDVIDDEVFLVTLKNKNGKPVQLSFPLELGTNAGLAVGDFVSYLVVRRNGELDHEFRKESDPQLTLEESQEIDSFVDNLLDASGD